MNEMKFVKFQNITEQMANQKIGEPVHYIFALDDSGSMNCPTKNGKNRWNDLMAAFEKGIE